MEDLKPNDLEQTNNAGEKIEVNQENFLPETILSSDEILEFNKLDQAQVEPQIKSIQEEMEKFKSEDAVTRERELINKDPELKILYQDIIENNNFNRLREKSAEQVSNLSERYFGKFSLFKLREYFQKKEKLKSFERFVETVVPIRADKNNYEEFLSPKQVGSVASYGPQDTIVHSEDFVYGSFSEIGHSMSRGRNQHVLDEKDIAPRAQIIMNDIANVVARTPEGESFTKKYLSNVFDYDSGKKILTLYLASVFDNPQQAKDVLGQAGGEPHLAQRWDSEGMLGYRDSTFQGETTEEFLDQQKREKEMTQIFTSRMKDLFNETGIEPPLSIEVRVKDSARVLK